MLWAWVYLIFGLPAVKLDFYLLLSIIKFEYICGFLKSYSSYLLDSKSHLWLPKIN